MPFVLEDRHFAEEALSELRSSTLPIAAELLTRIESLSGGIAWLTTPCIYLNDQHPVLLILCIHTELSYNQALNALEADMVDLIMLE
jgi:hypothetical protein